MTILFYYTGAVVWVSVCVFTICLLGRFIHRLFYGNWIVYTRGYNISCLPYWYWKAKSMNERRLRFLLDYTKDSPRFEHQVMRRRIEQCMTANKVKEKSTAE